jgi:hypothetical protein
MTCREFVEHLAEFLSGELRESLRQQAQAHLLECPDCRHYQLSYAVTVRLTRVAYDDHDSDFLGRSSQSLPSGPGTPSSNSSAAPSL